MGTSSLLFNSWFCENIVQMSSFLVVFSCKHLVIWILIENFHPNVDFFFFFFKHPWILQAGEWVLLIKDMTIKWEPSPLLYSVRKQSFFKQLNIISLQCLPLGFLTQFLKWMDEAFILLSFAGYEMLWRNWISTLWVISSFRGKAMEEQT